MAQSPSRAPLAGGFLFSIAVLIGTFAGIARGQASFGFVCGVVGGLLVLIAVWLFDRRRG